MSSLLITVPKPCHEDWEDMTPEAKGRFCDACQTTVMDFSQLSDEELVDFFSKLNESLCGRFPVSKVNHPITYGNNSSSFTINLRAVVLGATLLVAVPGLAFQDNLTSPQFSLVQSIVDDTRLDAYYALSEEHIFSFVLTDSKSGEPAFGVKIIAYDKNGEMITGTRSDFDGEATLKLTKRQLKDLDKIELSSMEYLSIVLDTFDTAEMIDKYEIELQPIKHESFTMGIVYTPHSRRSNRRYNREERKEQRREERNNN